MRFSLVTLGLLAALTQAVPSSNNAGSLEPRQDTSCVTNQCKFAVVLNAPSAIQDCSTPSTIPSYAAACATSEDFAAGCACLRLPMPPSSSASASAPVPSSSGSPGGAQCYRLSSGNSQIAVARDNGQYQKTVFQTTGSKFSLPSGRGGMLSYVTGENLRSGLSRSYGVFPRQPRANTGNRVDAISVSNTPGTDARAASLICAVSRGELTCVDIRQQSAPKLRLYRCDFQGEASELFIGSSTSGSRCREIRVQAETVPC